MFSFGSSMVLVMAVHESPLAQPKNIFFGHLISILVGVILITAFLIISLGLSVGACVSVMMYLKIVHPPAAANPLIAH